MIFTLPNAADLGVLTAGSTAAGSNVANLQNPQITSFWRSAPDVLPGGVGTLAAGGGFGPIVYPSTRWTHYSWPLVPIDLKVGAIALINDSSRQLTGANTTKRFRARALTLTGGGGNSLFLIVRPAPLAPTLTNLTGAPSAGGPWLAAISSWLTAITPTSSTQAVFAFNASQTDGGALPLKAGANLQTFTVTCRKSGATGTAPTLSIDVYDADVAAYINVVSGLAITSTSPVVVTVQWNASVLHSLATTHAGIRVTGTAGSANTVEYAAVEWVAEHNGYTYDSGDQTVGYPAYVGQQASRVFSLVAPPPAAPLANIGYVLIDQLSTLDSYAQAGRFVAADTVQPFVNMDYNWGISWDDKSPVSETPGGQEWFEVRPKRRLGELVCNALRTAEAWDQIFSQLQGTVGITGNFLWIPDPAVPSEYYNNCLWARFDGLSPVKNPRFSRYSQSFKLKEVL